MPKSRSKPFRIALLMASTVLLLGCASVRTKTPDGKAVEMDRQHFAAYVERVFRHHNSVVDQLLYISDDPENRNSPLGRAEAKMTFACLPLNEVVSASTIGQNTSLWTRMHLSEAVPECEAATRHVEELMPSDD